MFHCPLPPGQLRFPGPFPVLLYKDAYSCLAGGDGGDSGDDSNPG